MIPELVKFYLYPKRLNIDDDNRDDDDDDNDNERNNESYGNFTTQLGDTFYRTSIYYAKDYFDDGFRVRDLSCYSSVVEFFRGFSPQTAIRVRDDDGKRSEEVIVFGFIVIIK